MIGSVLVRALIMVFGYAYPGYECYKTVEKNKIDIEQLRFWCQYWILVALLTVFEKFGDAFVSWLPMYTEAKLAFFIYLWYPKTKGATYVYEAFLRPYLLKHEKEIDRNLLELKTRAADLAVLYWQKVAAYVQTRVFEILQYCASMSTTKPRANQQEKAAEAPQVPTTIQPQPPSRTSSKDTTQLQHEVQEAVPPPAQTTSTPAEIVAADQPSKSKEVPSEADKKKPEPTLSVSKSDVSSASKPQETVLEEASSRLTRGRLKKARSK